MIVCRFTSQIFTGRIQPTYIILYRGSNPCTKVPARHPRRVKLKCPMGMFFAAEIRSESDPKGWCFFDHRPFWWSVFGGCASTIESEFPDWFLLNGSRDWWTFGLRSTNFTNLFGTEKILKGKPSNFLHFLMIYSINPIAHGVLVFSWHSMGLVYFIYLTSFDLLRHFCRWKWSRHEESLCYILHLVVFSLGHVVASGTYRIESSVFHHQFVKKMRSRYEPLLLPLHPRSQN